MASFSNSLNIAPGASVSSRVRLDQSHLTTMDFGQIVPLYNISTLPRDKFDIDFNVFSRVAPLNFPAYVDVNLVAVTCYVPYYQVFDQSDAFFTGLKSRNGKTTSLPYFTQYDLDMLFFPETGDVAEFETVTVSTAAAADIVGTRATSKEYYSFTYYGRFIYKILRSLGYQLSCGIDLPASGTSSYVTSAKALKLNALPLLCFCKAYNDWFSSSYNFASSTLGAILEGLKHSNYSSNVIDTNTLDNMLGSIRLMYKSDYFTNSWRYTNSPLPDPTMASFVVPQSGTNSPHVISSSQNETYTTINTGGSLGYLNATQMRALTALDNFIRRNNYAGTKPAIRALAKFGIKTEDFKSNYADILKIKRIPLNIGDVTQTSESTDSPLGSYSGKGIVSGDDRVSINCSDYGQIIVIGFLQVDTAYPFAYDREVLKSDLFDFYQESFDGLGMQAISYNELVSDPSHALAPGTSYMGNNVFGFTERYNEYRTSRDKITGDFTLFNELYAWHAGRELNQFRSTAVNAQTDDFIYYSNRKQSEFDRIFALTDAGSSTAPDHFYMACYFKVNAERPIKNSNQVSNLGVGDINIEKNGTHVE